MTEALDWEEQYRREKAGAKLRRQQKMADLEYLRLLVQMEAEVARAELLTDPQLTRPQLMDTTQTNERDRRQETTTPMQSSETRTQEEDLLQRWSEALSRHEQKIQQVSQDMNRLETHLNSSRASQPGVSKPPADASKKHIIVQLQGKVETR